MQKSIGALNKKNSSRYRSIFLRWAIGLHEAIHQQGTNDWILIAASFQSEVVTVELSMTLLRFIIVFALFGLTTNTCYALTIEYRINKVHGLYNFIGALKEWPARSKQLREIFLQSSFSKNQEFKAQLASLDSLDQNFSQWQNFFEIQSVLAKDLADFDSRISGILPRSDQSKLISILNFFEPSYDALIWQPSKKKLSKFAAKFTALSKRRDIRMVTDEIPNFYGRTNVKNSSFIVGLLPIPGAKVSTYAKSLGAVESVEVAVDEDDLNGTFGVVIHELCHSFSNVSTLSKTFEAVPGEYSAPSYRAMEEGLATTIGNGIIYQRVAGKPDPKKWYNDATIDSFAHEILPLVEQYLSGKRSLDSKFVNSAVSIFREKLSTLAYDFGSILNAINLLSNFEDMRSLGKEFRKEFTVTSIYRGSLSDEKNLSELIKSNWMASLVVVVRPSEVKSLRGIPALANVVGESLNRITNESDSVWGGISKAGRPILVFVVDEPSKLNSLLKQLRSKQRLGPNEFSRLI